MNRNFYVMNRKFNIIAVLLISIFILSSAAVSAQEKYSSPSPQQREHDFAPDQPEDEEDLNRELWEFAKKTPYAEITRYVAQAQGRAQATQTAVANLPNGWRIAPAGTQIDVGKLPYEAILFAGRVVVLNTGYYNKTPQEVSIVDANSAQVLKTLPLASMFPSAQVGMDGDLYISGGYEGKLYRIDRQFNIAREYTLGGYAAGLAPVDETHIAIAYMVAPNAAGDYAQGKLVILNTVSGKIEREIETGYFPYTVRRANNKLYVSLLGENRLLVYNSQFNLIKSIDTGRTPQDICVDADRLYVVNSGSDDISVIDTRSDKVTETINVNRPHSRFGAQPTSCAVDGNRLYVTLAGINAVAVIDKNSGREIGAIPTGWYPTKVLANDRQLFVLSAKGIRARRPNPLGPQPVPNKGSMDYYVLTQLKGTLAIVRKDQVETNRAAWSKQVADGAPLYDVRQGFRLPIKHIFYIIRENRTYDQVLGDLGRGNGDPTLTLFGQDVTPNGHAIARSFVTLDNFYASGEISVLGHSFTTSGYASPFLEWLGNAAYSNRYKGYPFGTVPAVYSPAYLWDILDEKNIDYRIYGENYFLFTRVYRIIKDTYGAESEIAKKFYARSMTLAAKADRGKAFYQFAKSYYQRATTLAGAVQLLGDSAFANGFSQILTGDASLAQALATKPTFRRRVAEFLYRYPSNYSSWDLSVSDFERAAAWREDFNKQLRSGKVAQFSYLWLPNDHTAGSDTKILNPYQFVAQNDAALGRIVETISHSPIWRESLILVEEDDAQNGPDHVDATRTVALAVSPYVKRNAIVSDRYDQLSALRTIEMLLGLNSLNLNDRTAVPMFSIFTTRPDFTPYTITAPSSYLPEADKARDKIFESASRQR